MSKRNQRPTGAALRGMRSCIACRGRFQRESLARLVVSPDGQVLVDRYLRAPGRGAHLCYAFDCVERVEKIRALNRAFKMQVEPITSSELRKQLISAIDARIANLLSIGRKAGNIISGTDTLLRKSRFVRLLIIAVDTADDARQKLSRSVFGEACAVVHYGDAEWLGNTQQKEKRVALGISDESLASRILEEIERRSRVLVAA